MDQKEYLAFQTFRRFGVELEINSFDMRNRPIGYEEGKLPEGIYYIGNLVKKISNEMVLIHKWGNDHHNDSWVVKPDGSCGMEICTPVLKGWHGLMRVCHVAEGLSKDEKVSSDGRCSLHLHIDVSDLSELELNAVLTWWIKAEAVFMDAMPSNRKRNQYCQFIGQSDLIDSVEDDLYGSETLMRKLGICKYYSINTYHYQNRKRKTIEVRIMDNECCLNPWTTKNWVRLVLHFIERVIRRGLPENYKSNDQWSGYCWLDPKDVFELLGFLPDQYDLSPGLQQVRLWFLSRLFSYGRNSGLAGAMSDQGRKISIEQVDELRAALGEEGVISAEEIYSEKFRA